MNSPLILAGAGHAHLVTLRRWIDKGFRPPPGTLLLSPTPAAWYSGMMPGLLAGRFTAEDCSIKLAPLGEACGVDLRLGQMTRLNADGRSLSLEDGSELHYHLLSLNTGSVPPLPRVDDQTVMVIPAKPFPALHSAWQAWRQQPANAPGSIAVLGGGAAAFELALALRASLPDAELALICSAALLAAHPPALARRARRLLAQRNIQLIEQQSVTRVAAGHLYNGDQPLMRCEALVAATGASAPDWLRSSGLAVDTGGFAHISPALVSTSHTDVFATGDCASLSGAIRSGVYAVRQGSVLAGNLAAKLSQAPLQDYRPQQHALALLATADGGALMSYGRWGASGRLFGWWKDRLDIGFMRRHRL